MVTLYQFEVSPFCDKVRRILALKNVDYTVVESSMLKAGKYGKAKKLPVLEIDGQIIEDSTQIAYYLDEAYPQPRIIPESARERALCHILEDWADESLYFYDIALHFCLDEYVERRMGHLLKHERGPLVPMLKKFGPKLLRMMANSQGVGRRSKAVLLEDIGRHLQAVADHLGDRDWLVGEAISLADIAVYAQVNAIKVAREGAEEINQHSVVVQWITRVESLTGPMLEVD